MRPVGTERWLRWSNYSYRLKTSCARMDPIRKTSGFAYGPLINPPLSLSKISYKYNSMLTQPSGENLNTMHTMHMTSSKCVLQQCHLLCYESEPDPWTLIPKPNPNPRTHPNPNPIFNLNRNKVFERTKPDKNDMVIKRPITAKREPADQLFVYAKVHNVLWFQPDVSYVDLYSGVIFILLFLGFGLKIGLWLGWVLGLGFRIGNLIGGAAGTVDPCGRKTPVHRLAPVACRMP